MMRRALCLAVLAAAANGQPIYDLLLKNGSVLDPANRRGGRMDVAVIGTRIARVAADLPAAQARVVIDAGRYYVTPGLIDIHARFGAEGVLPDHNELPSGVTTAVDAGSSGWRSFEDFKTTVIDRSRTQVLAFLAAGDDPEAAARTARKYPQMIVGIAADAKSLDRALQAAELSHTAVMTDSSSALNRLRPGDIAAGVYAGPAPAGMPDARKRGVLFGSDVFRFSAAVPAIRQGLLPDIISTGMDPVSILLPRANMATTISKFLNMGLTLEQIIERVTVNPARAIRRTDLGTLSEGAGADIALLEAQEGSFGFVDSGQSRLSGARRLRCVLTVRNGAIVWDSEGLSATDSTKAGPYSNFK
jgi:dihydroorotase